MHLLLITPKIPYPVTEGGKIAQYAFIDWVRFTVRVSMVLPAYSDTDIANITALQELWPEVHIEIIDLRIRPSRKEKENLSNRVLAKTGKALNRISRLVLKENKEKDYKQIVAEEHADLPATIEIKGKQFIEQLSSLIGKISPDIIQIDFIDLADLVFAIPPHIKTVLVHHELQFVMLQSKLLTQSGTKRNYEGYVLNYIKHNEINLLKLFSGVVVFSDDDKQKIQKLLPETNICSAPFAVLDESFIELKPGNGAVKKLVFVGGEEHAPNKDAIEWYIDEIDAEVKKKVQLELHIIGNWSEASKNRYNNRKDIIFAGFVDDLGQYCQNSIMIVPVRVGSGIRTKILYGMAFGVPVISAPVGCEGIKVKHGREILIASTKEEFAEGIYRLYDDEDFAAAMASEAQQTIRKYYSQAYTSTTRLNFYKELLDARRSSQDLKIQDCVAEKL